jgi:hypothetical protein
LSQDRGAVVANESAAVGLDDELVHAARSQTGANGIGDSL